MGTEITIKDKRTKKGEKMTSGRGWRLVTAKKKQGSRRVLVGTLFHNYNFGRCASRYSAYRSSSAHQPALLIAGQLAVRH